MDRRGRNPLPKQKKSIFDGLPIATDRSYLREDLAKIDEGWTVSRFDSLPHVVHILTSKDRETEAQHLKEQSEIIEEIVDEVVHAYHGGFNKAIQNYSQILRLFSESAESIGKLKVDLAEAKKLLGSRNKQLHQLWYRSVTLRHIISLLDQIENVSKVPARVEKLISAKHLYAAVQLHVQSMLMLEREGLHGVGALQDARSELSKLRGVLFYKIVEDLHSHLYNKGEFCGIQEKDDDIQRMTAAASTISGSRPSSRRTHTRSDNQLDSPSFRKSYMRPGSMDGSSFDGHDDDTVRSIEAPEDGYDSSILVTRINGLDGSYKDSKTVSHRIPSWLLSSTPNEFIESMTKSDERMHVKYLQTLVECLCMLGKVAAGGAVLCQRFRPTIHEIIVSKINVKASEVTSLRLTDGRASPHPGFIANYIKGGPLQSPGLLNPKNQKETSLTGAAFAISPVSAAMAPNGTAQVATRVLLTTIFDSITRVLENHIAVGALLETRSTQSYDMNTPKSVNGDATWGSESEGSQATGGYSVGFSLAVIQSECQQLICEILRATPEAASADAAVQTARLANKAPAKEKRNKVDEGLSFAFRFTDGALPLPSEGIDAIRQAWGRRNPNTKEGYGTSKVLPDQGIYLIASIYRPVVQFTDKVASMLPEKYSQLGNDGLQAFVENFLKDHFLPALFVDYRKCVQQAISSPAAFRPRTHVVSSYTPLVEKGRPVLQGLLAIDFLAKEVLGWAQAMPKYAGELVEYVQTFLERTYERSRTSFMEAVLEKQSYKLMGRQDVESLMKHEPASACLFGQPIIDQNGSDSETIELEREISDLLLGLQPIKQENLIRDDNKLILLASLSDSLEYLADSILRLGQNSSIQSDQTGTQVTEQISYSASPLTEGLRSLSNEYRSLAVECLKVLRLEMQLETILHLQEMTSREYLEDQDAEEPEDFIISLTSQVTRRDEEISAFVPEAKRNYIFSGIYGVAANASIKALADLKSINLFGVQQICRNSIALEQALTAIPPIDSEAVQQRLDRVRTYYELLNLPFEALLAFISEHEHLFSKPEYLNLLNVRVIGREIPEDAPQRVSDILSH